MNEYYVQPGDKIEREKAPGIYHEGIMYYNDTVFHNTPAKGEHLSSFEEFAQGKTITVFPQSEVERNNNLNNIDYMLQNPRLYSYLSNNCEHTVNRAINGISRSPTLAVATTLAIVCGCMYLIRRNA